jgi:hypothetical protein
MLRFVDADGALAGPPLNLTVKVGPHTPGEMFFVPLALDLTSVRFTAPGDYVFELAINGKQMAETPLYVRRRPA